MAKALKACLCEVGRKHWGIYRPGSCRDYMEQKSRGGCSLVQVPGMSEVGSILY